MSGSKSEEGLFPPGMHNIEEGDLENHFLRRFPSSGTRKQLIPGLRSFLSALAAFGIEFEVWIDGSFTTTKDNPNDVDLVVFASTPAVNSLTDPKKVVLQGLIDRASTRHRFGCDVLFAPRENKDLRSYWRGWYGFDRNEQPKGMARIWIRP